MKKINFISFILIFAFSVSAAFAQKTYTPAKNSPTRATILNALRAPVSKELKQEVSFLVSTFKVQGNWAFISGQARNAKGGEVNWKITDYQEQIDDGAFDDNLFALLKKKGGKWSVITYAIGCTDVCYLGWDEEYKAPKAIFP
jgi:hypothetical protein